MHRNITNDKGASMIEVLVAATIFTIGILNMGHVIVLGGTAIQKARFQTEATALAQEMMEEVESKAFDEKTVNDTDPYGRKQTSTFTSYKILRDTTSGFPTDSGETATDKSTFDDVDDYAKFVESPVPLDPDFTRRATVVYAYPDSLGGRASLDRTEYKRVTVEVTSKNFHCRASLSSIVYYRGI